MAEGDRPVEVIRYATAGRRQPIYIGTDNAGVKIPGGPYTLLQAIGGPLVGVAAWSTRNAWAELLGVSFIASWLVVAGAFAVAVWMFGRIDLSDHNPLYSLLGAWRVLNQPVSGRVGGHTLARRPARTVHTGPSALGTLTNTSAAVSPTAIDDAQLALHDTHPASGDVGEVRHPLQAGSDATTLWWGGALAGTMSLAAASIAIVETAVSVWASTSTVIQVILIVVVLLVAAALAVVGRELSKGAWKSATREPLEGRHRADVIVDSIRSAMVIALAWVILTYRPPTTPRAALVVTVLGVGLIITFAVVTVWGRTTGRSVAGVTPRWYRQPLGRLLGDIQPLIAAAVVVVLAIHRSPSMASSLPVLFTLLMVALVVGSGFDSAEPLVSASQSLSTR